MSDIPEWLIIIEEEKRRRESEGQPAQIPLPLPDFEPHLSSSIDTHSGIITIEL